MTWKEKTAGNTGLALLGLDELSINFSNSILLQFQLDVINLAYE
jgi:hypothetical protein